LPNNGTNKAFFGAALQNTAPVSEGNVPKSPNTLSCGSPVPL
jgi:hypothetical protein